MQLTWLRHLYQKAVDARLSYSLAGVKGFSREVMLQGRKPYTLWISRDQIPASALIASKLAITESTPVYMLKRIHYIDTRDMSVAVSYVIMAAIGDVQDIGVSLYDYFSRNNIELSDCKAGSVQQCPTLKPCNPCSWLSPCRC